MEPTASPRPEGLACAFCGMTVERVSAIATCALCGMKIGPNHDPHIVRVDPDRVPAHFCSIGCMDNYELLKEVESAE